MLNEEMEQKPYKGKERINKNQTLDEARALQTTRRKESWLSFSYGKIIGETVDVTALCDNKRESKEEGKIEIYTR